MAHLYYDPKIGSASVGETVTIAGDEARHAVTVARLRAGEQILLGDGCGTIAKAQVQTVVAGRDPSFTALVSECAQHARPALRLSLVQALAKSGRDERAVEQSTEFGVDRCIPWQAARSVSRWESGTKIQKGVAKWQKIAREAAKQSLRAWAPVVSEPVDTRDLAALAAQPGVLMLVLHPWAETGFRQALAAAESAGAVQEVLFVVGPEGGITDAEIASLEAAGAHPVRLGEHVLRTSSAGPAALAALATLTERW